MVATNFGQNSNKGLLNNLIYGTMMVLYKMGIKLASNVEDGAKTTVYLVTNPEVKGVLGKYFGNSREEKPSENIIRLKKKNVFGNIHSPKLKIIYKLTKYFP